MNRLNRKVEYALMALKHMGSKYAGHLTTVKEVSEANKVPFDATARVMQVMAHHEVLRSEQGARGGYVLVKDLKKISLYELMSMVLGPMAVVKCIHASKSCELTGNCSIQSPLEVLNRKLIDFYSSISVHELLNLQSAVAQQPVVHGG